MRYIEVFTYAELMAQSPSGQTAQRAREARLHAIESYCNHKVNRWLHESISPALRYDRDRHSLQARCLRPCELIPDWYNEPWATQCAPTARDYRQGKLTAYYNWSTGARDQRAVDEALTKAYNELTAMANIMYDDELSCITSSADTVDRLTRSLLFTGDGRIVRASLILHVKERKAL